MELEFETADVFTETRFGGNPLAVVYAAGALDDATMQKVAREFNLAETVFVLSTEAAGARIRIFTPGTELPFAGHPNVGTAALLARRMGLAGADLSLDQAAGRVAARLRRDAGGRVSGAEITAPQPFRSGEAMDLAAVAGCLGLPATALRSAQLASCGTPFLLAELAEAATIALAAPDTAGFRATLPADRATGIMVYAEAGLGRLAARMFAPLVGIPEDPATGAAAVALAGMILERRGGEALELALTQGVEMGRPSLLALRAWRSAEGIRTAVGGGVVPVSRGVISL